jgi:hypothetical protein
MTETEIRAQAERLILEHNAEYEFCLVYEDEDLEGATEDEWRAVHDAMYRAQVEVTWDG